MVVLSIAWLHHLHLLLCIPIAPEIIHVPTDRAFTKVITDCLNLPTTASACNYLVNIDATVDAAVAHIKGQCPKLGGLEYGVPPLIISRLARGGKTTILKEIFTRLKTSGYAPIIVGLSNSSHFRHMPGQTHKDALLRLIASQLVNVEAGEEAWNLNISCDKAALL